MKVDFPVNYSLEDGTTVKVDRLDDGKGFTFILDKPTGQTDSFTWVSQAATDQPVNQEAEDPQRKEAIDLFVELESDDQ
ncbi:MAG: hypothetical protein ABIN01_18880 [Ferruginibacter sp.]